MATAASARQLSLLRKLANREAARRQKEADLQQQQSNGHENTGGSIQGSGSGSRPSSQPVADAAVDENKQWEELLQVERQKNDVEWAEVQKTLRDVERDADLTELARTGGEGSLARRRSELARLEHEIEGITADLPVLNSTNNEAILNLKTRAIFASSIEQYQEALHERRLDLERERDLLRDDERLLHDLHDVTIGLQARLKRLHQKSAESNSEKARRRKVKEQCEATRQSLQMLLKELSRLCTSLFGDESLNEQLSHLLDRLLNAAVDAGQDTQRGIGNDGEVSSPWIDLSVGQAYLPSIVDFLVSANVAEVHPRDARKIRLVDFRR